MYSEDEFLMLSGVQHFAFCRRQWALIHVEQQWLENSRTADGMIFHEKAHDEEAIEKRGNILITRGLRVHSFELGLSGQCDVVEFHAAKNGISIHTHDGKWLPYPVEYKSGEPKSDSCDDVQLCAQAMCLEEMLLCEINEGSFFYGRNKRRYKVEFSQILRDKVRQISREMHDYWSKGYVVAQNLNIWDEEGV